MGPTGPNPLLGHSTSSFSSSSPSSSIRVTSSRPPRVPRWLLFGTLGDRQKGVKDKIPDGGGSGWSGPHILGSDHPSEIGQTCSCAWDGRRCSLRFTNS